MGGFLYDCLMWTSPLLIGSALVLGLYLMFAYLFPFILAGAAIALLLSVVR
jgi:hypothetical protein